jgi:hypothetical protein
MATTVIGLYADFSKARRVSHALRQRAIEREAISIVANREATSVREAASEGARGVSVEVGPASRGQLAALIELGVPAEEAQQYAEAIRRGGALVTVTAPERRADEVMDVMGHKTEVDLQARRAQRRWHSWPVMAPRASPGQPLRWLRRAISSGRSAVRQARS